MKSLIVFYSLEGNTEYAANAAASLIGADVLRIEPVHSYPSSGFRKFFWCGKSAVMAEAPQLQPYEFQPERYDCVIFGFPVWAGNVAPPIRTFARDNRDALKNKRVAAFACESGAGAEKAFGKLKACLGVDKLEAELVLIDPKDKPSEENNAKMRAFCDRLSGIQGS